MAKAPQKCSPMSRHVLLTPGATTTKEKWATYYLSDSAYQARTGIYLLLAYAHLDDISLIVDDFQTKWRIVGFDDVRCSIR
jgi:hypothetical protein